MRWLRPCPLYTPPVATTDWMAQWGLRTGSRRLATTTPSRKVRQTRSFRGSKSRNKVSVGEPAEGSLPHPKSYINPQMWSLDEESSFFLFWTPFELVEWISKVTKKLRKENTTFNGGSLGSCIDEERSKLRYVMWIAETSESSSLWTQLALLGIPRSMPAWVSLQHFQKAKKQWMVSAVFYFSADLGSELRRTLVSVRL